LPEAEQRNALPDCRELADAVYGGFELSLETPATAQHHFGETVLRDGNTLVGFAVCHCGAKIEAGSGSCYVKF
jgi:hypothetical protein